MQANTNRHRAKAIVDEVYGTFTDENWVPKKFKERSSRYLWSDAFGICNYISLYCSRGTESENFFLDQADALIRDVHETLGRERHSPYNRLGTSTDQHPLLGGLRIGKENEESHPDGDGQYFHYLTKWMFALRQMSRVKKDPKYLYWAIEMAKAVHPKFFNPSGSRMFWKLSIDLSQPLVPSEGHLDPLDALVTYRLLQDDCEDSTILMHEIKQAQKLVENRYKSFHSSDPLDAGEGMWLSAWYAHEPWSSRLLKCSIENVDRLFNVGYFNQPKTSRLLFREMGTTLGLQAAESASNAATLAIHFDSEKWRDRVQILHEFWDNHVFERDRDISPLMYASSLLPTSWMPGVQLH